jgi:uncharacterized protein YdeI (YjbR/CyaY-like superfamily)
MASKTSPLPPDLEQALASEPAAKAAFDKLAPSHQRAHIEAIAGAKKPETRARRIAWALEKLRSG